MQSQLTAALKQVRLMADKHASSAFLTNLGLGHTQLCEFTEGKYHEAVGEGIWPPATNTKDSKVAPSGYYTAAQLNTLVQEFGSGKGHGGTSPHDKSQDACHYCGETGHWAKDCTKKACNLAAGHLSSGGHGGVVLVVEILVARMTIVVMVVDTTLVVVEGEMAVLGHDASLLHGSWRAPHLVNPKPCRRMDKPSIGVPSACLLSGRPCTALPTMAPMGTLLRPMPRPPTLLPCPLTRLLGWLM